jgi:hypothetical protein
MIAYYLLVHETFLRDDHHDHHVHHVHHVNRVLLENANAIHRYNSQNFQNFKPPDHQQTPCKATRMIHRGKSLGMWYAPQGPPKLARQVQHNLPHIALF